MSGCEYPGLKPTTGYRYGCRCDRCRTGSAATKAAANKRYVERHPERYAARRAAYRNANRDLLREKGRAYARRNRDQQNARRLAARTSDPESYYEQQNIAARRQYAANPERFRGQARKQKEKRHSETRPSAKNWGKAWTGPELEVALREDLTSTQAALLLGRTASAVEHQRHEIRRDPRKADLAGVNRPIPEPTKVGLRDLADAIAAERGA